MLALYLLLDKLLIKRVAIVGDLLHQGGQTHRGIVGIGPAAADPRAHEHRAGQDRRLLEENLFILDLFPSLRRSIMASSAAC